MDNQRVKDAHYEIHLSGLASTRREVPFTVVYETAHSGGDIGILDGEKNRARVLPHLTRALSTPPDPAEFEKVVNAFKRNTERTLQRAANLSSSLTEWDKQAQYEAHAQVVFRLRDQYGVDVERCRDRFQVGGGAGEASGREW